MIIILFLLSSQAGYELIGDRAIDAFSRGPPSIYDRLSANTNRGFIHSPNRTKCGHETGGANSQVIMMISFDEMALYKAIQHTVSGEKRLYLHYRDN